MSGNPLYRPTDSIEFNKFQDDVASKLNGIGSNPILGGSQVEVQLSTTFQTIGSGIGAAVIVNGEGLDVAVQVVGGEVQAALVAGGPASVTFWLF